MIHSYILTGFLGVGKTTILTNIIKEHFCDKKIALIVNEFGKIGIDGDVLRNVHSDVLEIAEGCICCQLSDEFEKGVKEIIKKYDPEIIFIEASGASEPFPIFLSLHVMGICIDGVICVIDTKSFDNYKENVSAKNQIGSSNIILLNKTDLVDEDQLHTVQKEVIAIKNENDLKSNISGGTFFKSYVIEHAKQGMVDKKLFNSLERIDDLFDIDKKDYLYHHNHTQKDSITQKVCYIKKGTTSKEILTLLRTLPRDVYRAKGVVKLEDFNKPQLINYAFGSITQEDLDSYQGESIIVFIGKSIEQKVNFLAKVVECLILPQFSVNP
ncbi:MAG: GTP-binding protein [Campylobacterota bacterium]|nr:GTP-binding protein [Campylobacterota bacterium]